METSSKNKLTLICVDSSEHSKRAVEWYFKMIHKENDVVGLVHVHVMPDLPTFGMYAGGLVATELYQEQVKESIDGSKTVLESYKTLLAEKGVTEPKSFHKPMDDSIGHTICNVAKENDASLVVIGQRGLGVIRRTLFGSVSEYVLHHAHIPVAVVPPPKKE